MPRHLKTVATPPPPGPALRITDLRRSYGRGQDAVPALRGVSADLPRGSFTAVMGPSGSGKSTFLHCAAGLDSPDAGSVTLADVELSTLSERDRTVLRRNRIGFVFQAFNLLPGLSVLENVLLPERLGGRRPKRKAALAVLDRVGLAGHAKRRPAELSGGQQQRVAVARALVSRPDVVFADEPTGALDTSSAADVLGLLRALVDQDGGTVVMVTHDPSAAAWADRVMFLADGLLVDTLDRPEPQLIADRMFELSARPRAVAGVR